MTAIVWPAPTPDLCSAPASIYVAGDCDHDVFVMRDGRGVEHARIDRRTWAR